MGAKSIVRLTRNVTVVGSSPIKEIWKSAWICITQYIICLPFSCGRVTCVYTSAYC